MHISNHTQWAQAQGYSLTSISGNYAVRHHNKPVGALIRNEYGFSFVDHNSVRTTPDVDYDSNSSEAFVSKSFGFGFTPIAGTEFGKNAKELVLPANVSGTGSAERVAECNYWLPYAAEHYKTSRDIRDYVLVPIPSIFSDLPNTNGDSLSLRQMLRFDPQLGMQMYKTFRGKGTFLEHANKDITKAKGIILDAFLRPVPFNRKYYKIVLLLAYDRTKDPELASRILRNETNAYSVGFYYSSYTCSICGTRVGRGINTRPCVHTQLGRPTYKQTDSKIVYRQCEDAVGFECSSVSTPAFVSAIGPHVYDAGKL